MMKIAKTKLVLRKETLKALVEKDLTRAVGGAGLVGARELDEQTIGQKTCPLQR